MIVFTNPRITAIINDWPLGGSKRGACNFNVEHNPKKGYRVGKTATGKTKFMTFGGKAVIVDGDNGKTYILQKAGSFDFLTISRGADLKNATHEELGQTNIAGAATINPESPHYAALLALIEQAYQQQR